MVLTPKPTNQPTAEGDTTDDEEDLPMPTPKSASKLRRVSMSSLHPRPQIVHTNHEGPELCSWVADPSRPICVIEGSKQTFLFPSTYPRFSVGSEGTASDSNTAWIHMDPESESEQSMFASADPGLSAVFGGSVFASPGGYSNLQSDTADLMDRLDDKSMGSEDAGEIDPFEAQLFDWILSDMEEESSEAEMEKAAAVGEREGGEGSDEEGEDAAGPDEDECGQPTPQPPAVEGGGDSSAHMLRVWDKVSVTAFRKRQIQHTQKQLPHHAAGYHKGREGRLSDTITPTKKRRPRQKFLASKPGGMMGNNPSLRRKLAR